MSMRRRELLRTVGGLCAWASLPDFVGCADLQDGEGDGAEVEFLHGVASGDPLPDTVLLWTRITPRGVPSVPSAPAAQAARAARAADASNHQRPRTVHWEVAADSEFRERVAEGDTQTDASRDYTVKVDADGLESGTVYYYRFSVGHVTSPIGRTQTAVAGATTRLRFAVVSCASLAHGYFHGYRSISERLDLDAVIHLGDYIYEYGDGEYGSVRGYEPPHELHSLSDYRARYAQYRRDPDVQALHRQLPLIAIWDDHEFANNAYEDGSLDTPPGPDMGAFGPRKAAALQAYVEWMPIREPSQGRCFRSFAFGDLADLVLLDTRVWGRQRQLASTADPALRDVHRTLLGPDQESWLTDQLSASRARWRLIGQQVMVGRYPIETNLDTWDGYPAARQRLVAQLRAAPDTVVLTGDVHSSWAMNIVDEPLEPSVAGAPAVTGNSSVAVEFVTPGITSPLLDQASGEIWQARVLAQPHVKYVQLWRRGYMVLDVDRSRVQAAWYHYDAVDQPEPVEPSFGGAAAVYSGQPFVQLEAIAAAPRDSAAAT